MPRMANPAFAPFLSNEHWANEHWANEHCLTLSRPLAKDDCFHGSPPRMVAGGEPLEAAQWLKSHDTGSVTELRSCRSRF
jgi:hypothetical protein